MLYESINLPGERPSMTPFLRRTSGYLLERFGNDLTGLCVVLPNRRGGLFLRKYLAEELGRVAWSPEIYSIEDFLADLSGLQEADGTDTLFRLYEVHREIAGEEAQPFEEFIRWAPQLLSDFDEADRYLADTGALFTGLSEARAITLWNPDGSPLTEFEKRYLRFFRSLADYYRLLREKMLSVNRGWQGLIFRQAALRVAEHGNKMPWKHVVFAGFNALTRAEEAVMDHLKEQGMATILWDADRYYLEDEQQEAGEFLRKWFKKWKVDPVQWVTDELQRSPRQVTIIGSPDAIGQIRHCGSLLADFSSEKDVGAETAVVLLDENLLIPLLHALPDSVGSLNVTAGLPLALTPAAGLVEAIFRLHLHAKRVSVKKEVPSEKYYFKDALKLIRHPSILRCLESGREILPSLIAGSGGAFLSCMDILNQAGSCSPEEQHLLSLVFREWTSPGDGARCFQDLIPALLQSPADDVEQESLGALLRLTNNILTLMARENVVLSLSAVLELYRQSISVTRLPFYGEPLEGMQIMGMLETRTLDFERIILLSCNEDLLPGSKVSSSYIPFDIRRSFGLPTYRQKDAVYAYHFFRLLQRAKSVWVYYTTEADELGGGDMSRYLRQVVSELAGANPETIITSRTLATPSPGMNPVRAITVEKEGQVLDLLIRYASKGFSAKSVNAFRNCPLKFYFSEIARIYEEKETDDTIDPALLGSTIHRVLHELYLPVKGRALTEAMIHSMKEESDAVLEKAFLAVAGPADMGRGKNLLLFRVARMMIGRFLRKESEMIRHLNGTGGQCVPEILEEELKGSVNIPFGNSELQVILKGVLDRVDRMGSAWRIVDYKTGSVDPVKLKVKAWEDLVTDPDLNISFQLLFYHLLLRFRLGNVPAGEAVAVSLKRAADANFRVSVPGELSGKPTPSLDPAAGDRFREIVREIIAGVYDTSQPFIQTDDPDVCKYCPYINICGR